jgi:hypothetical protein
MTVKKEDVPPQVQVEFMASGSVSSKIYWKYFKASKSLCSSFLLVIGFILSQTLISLCDYWLSYW